MSEKERIAFIEQRDGKGAALKFAEQGIAIYTKASIDKGTYKESLEYYQQFLEAHGYEIQFVVMTKLCEGIG